MKVIFQSEKIFLRTTLKNASLMPKSFLKQPFEKIKDEILGKNFEVSIVLIGKDYSNFLNKTYRKKDYPTDTLSFSFSSLSGEIFLTPEIAKKKSKDFELSFSDYLFFLLIHSFLHLKGLDHGKKMEAQEQKYFSKFK